MDWRKCEEEFIRQVDEDSQKIQSILKQVKVRLERVEEMKFSEERVSLWIEDYYEVIKELLVAYLLKKGLRSKNHQCLFTYFYKEHPDYETEVMIISQMSYFRNRLCYYGERVPLSFYEKNRKKIMEIVELLKSFV